MSNTTKAHLDGATSAPTTHIAVLAQDTTAILSLAGQLTIGGTAGIGAGVDVEVITKDTQAWLAKTANVVGTGNLTVDAVSSEDITSISLGGGFAGTAAVNINAAVAAVNVTTKAFIADGTSAVDAAGVAVDGSVRIAATETLDLNVIGGNISGGGTAAVGASVAVPVTTKETHAWIGNWASVAAKGGTPLAASSGTYTVTTKDMRFTPADINTGTDTITLAGHGFQNGDVVYYDAGCATLPACGAAGLTHREQAYFIVGATANTFQVSLTKGGAAVNITGQGSSGNQRFYKADEANVTADSTPRFNPVTTVDSGTDQITFDLGGAANDDAVVYSSGGGAAIGGLVDGGTYFISDVAGNTFKLRNKKSTEAGSAVIDLDITGMTALQLGRAHSLAKSGTAPSGDPSSYGPRAITAGTDAGFRGVAVTANNSDNIGAFGIGFAIGGTAGVAVTGSVTVNTVHTSAHIGANARINCGVTCATTVSGANGGQSVRVAAANQYYSLGIAAALAIGGTAGVAVPVAVRVANIDTYAYIGTGTTVRALNNIEVTAQGKGTVVSVAAGAGGGTVGVAGTVGVTVLNVNTFACTGTPGGTDAFDCTGNGATLRAGNNVVVSAQDDTKAVLLTIAMAGGLVGVGAAVGVAVMNKDVQAYLGGNGAVTALATGAAIGGVSDGTVSGSGFGRQGFSGVIVRADSSEDIFGLAPAIGGGFVGVAGGVQVTLLTVLVKAFIKDGGTVDSSAGVNVSATDRFKSLTIAGGIAGGFVGVAGGVDIGVANNSVVAELGASLTVTAGGNVEVYAVTKKDVSTFAVSAAGGFVGVAAAVSVWTIGTTATGGYHAADGGDDRGAWDSGTSYRKGDVVSYNGKRYSAKVDNTLTGAGNNPEANPTQWLGAQSALGRGDYSGSAVYNKGDEVHLAGRYYTATEDGVQGIDPFADTSSYTADGSYWKRGGSLGSATQGGEAAQGGSGGYKDNTLTGSTASAAAPDPWNNATSYDEGERVSFGGRTFAARHNVASGGSDPTVASTDWREISGAETKTNDRLAGHLGGVSGTISGAAPAQNPTTQALAAPATGGTTARVGATITAGGHIHVKATDRLLVLGVAGAAAVGAVGIGISVLVLNIKSKTEAAVLSTASLSAGNEIVVSASMDEDSVAIGFAGGGGLVGISGQVVVVNDSGVQNAHIDGGAQVRKAGSGVTLASTADRNLETYTIAAAIGAIGAGISVSVINISGDNTATTGSVAVAADGPVAGFNSTVTDNITANALAVSVAGGIGAIGGVVAFVSLAGTATASASPVGTIGAGGVHVTATGTRTVTSRVLNVTFGAVAIGLTVARVNSGRHLEALVGGNITTAGAVESRATANNSAVLRAPGVAVGLATIGITVVFAELSGHTFAKATGTVSGASAIDVIATAANTSDARVELYSGSLLGLSGAWASSRITSGAYILAIAEAGSSLGALGAITIKAGTQGQGNLATSTIDSASVAGLADLKAFVAIGAVRNETRATLDGAITGAGSVTVLADSHNTAFADILTGSVALASLAIGLSDASVSGGAVASGAGSIAAGGADISITATSVNQSTAKSNVMTGGILLGVAVGAPNADISAPTRAQWDGTVTAGANMTVEADATNTAKSTLKVLSTGLGSVTGGAANATIAAATVTSAVVGGTAKISGLTAKLLVYAHAVNRAIAVAGGKGFGGISIGVIYPAAVDRAVTKAELNGDVGSTHVDPAVGTVGDAGAAEVEVKAVADDATKSSVDSLAVGLVAVSASTAEARTETVVAATFGGGKVTAAGNVTLFAQSKTDADSFASAVSGGLIDIQAGFTAESHDNPDIFATVTGGFVQAGGVLSVTALHGIIPGSVSDGTITGINCNGADTICFSAAHGIDTGSIVTYSAPATGNPLVDNGTIPNPLAIGGLGDGRTYGVISVDGTTLRLGEQFDAANPNDPDIPYDGQLIQLDTGSLYFANGHNFLTGDRVVYSCGAGGTALGTTPAGGLVCGASYYIFVVDSYRIRLSTSLLDADGFIVRSFTPDGSTLTGGNTINVGSQSGLVEGQGVVYYAPAVVDFKSTLIDINTDGSGQLEVDGDGKIVRDGGWNTIYAPSHGWSNGNAVVYTVTDPAMAIGGLANGATYYVLTADPDGSCLFFCPLGASGPHMIRLATSLCHTGLGTKDVDPGPGVDLQPCGAGDIQAIPISTITNPLDANFFKAIIANHTLRRVGYETIGLVEGNMYYVHLINDADDDKIQLRDAAGNTVGGLSTKLGSHACGTRASPSSAPAPASSSSTSTSAPAPAERQPARS